MKRLRKAIEGRARRLRWLLEAIDPRLSVYKRLIIGLMVFGFFIHGAHAIDSVRSPDGKIEVRLEMREDLSTGIQGAQLCYSVYYKGETVLIPSPFALEFAQMPPLGGDLKVIQSSEKTIHDEWERLWGRRKLVMNHCNELTLELTENQAPQREFHFIVRVFNEGVAFRYALPDQPGIEEFQITSEHTEFRFARNHPCWAANDGGFYSGQESEVESLRLDELDSETPYMCPMLVHVRDVAWVLLTEANLTDWAGMYLQPTGNVGALRTALSPSWNDPSVRVTSKTPRQSPWRVLMVAEHPGRFMESDILQNLNEPLALEDPSWIQPGKSAWDRWWCGDHLPDADFEVGMNNETMKYFIDFAAEMGWQYQLVDWQWYGEPFAEKQGAYSGFNPDADITTSIPEVDIPHLVQYANERGVDLWVWLHWKAADVQMDKAFPLYQKWGVKGVKIDFMNRDDQEMVNTYHRIVKKAADHQLLVNFHGAYKPTGWSRTYPNVITREGVLGNEYTKWSDRITPDHCLTLPFTRGALGEMDFTPGGFRQKGQETFRVVGHIWPGPFVMGTRAYQLAMFVVYESALQVVCDSPYNYRSSPAGLDFLKRVPTNWEDTRCIQGAVGDFITVARKSGESWFVGSMTDWDERELAIPLDFLGKGSYEAEIWMDAYESGEYPDRLMKTKKTVTADDVIQANLASGGGHVMVLRPVKTTK